MKEPHGARHPPRPRVMRRDLVTGWRSVDRGSVNRAIELRKKQFPCDGVVGRGVVHTVPRAKGERRGGTAESLEPERAWTLPGREPRDPTAVRPRKRTDRPVKASGKTGMYGRGKSDGPIVPMKPANKDGKSAERVEGRGPTKGNTRRRAAPRTPSRTSVSPGLARVRQGLCALALDPR